VTQYGAVLEDLVETAITSGAAGSMMRPPPTSTVRALGRASAIASIGWWNSGGESAGATAANDSNAAARRKTAP